jgi:hypothetical protein
LSEENEMVVRFSPLATNAVPRPPITGRDVGFHPDDRLQPCLFRLFLELPRPVKIAVVGYCESRLLELEGSGDEVIDAVGAIEK